MDHSTYRLDSTRRSPLVLTLKPKMRPPSPSIPGKEFLYASLKESLRLDGRSPLQQRKPGIRIGPDLGYVECSLGKTRYECLRISLSYVKLCYTGSLLRLTRKSSNPSLKGPSRDHSQFIPRYRLWRRATTRLDGRCVPLIPLQILF
jgi:hypothetical protein